MLEKLKANLKAVLIGIAIVVSLLVVAYVGGCNHGKDVGFVSGYKQGESDSRCEGGTHDRPFPKP